MALIEGILAQPLGLQLWVAWMMLINGASVFFLRHVEARWALLAFLCAAMFMAWLAELNGYNRLLGLAHCVFWTPLLVYLGKRRSFLADKGRFTVWIRTLMLTDGISLLLDYADVARYVLADRS